MSDNKTLQDSIVELISKGNSPKDIIKAVIEEMYFNIINQLEKLMDDENNEIIKKQIIELIIDFLNFDNGLTLPFDDNSAVIIGYSSSTTDDNHDIIGEIKIIHEAADLESVIDDFNYDFIEEDREVGIGKAIDRYISYRKQIDNSED